MSHPELTVIGVRFFRDSNRGAIFLLSLLLLLLATPVAGRGEIQPAGEEPRLKLRPAGPSIRARAKWEQWRHRQGAPQTFAPPETLRVLALRVSFVPDNSNLTTGDGTFDLSQPVEPALDPPPHDRTYFEHQLLAVSNYYRTVSNGQLVITAEVFPLEPTASYQLPNDMVYYGPEEPDSLVDQRLAELFRDALLVADTDPAIDFGRYDAFVVFHAGVGRDFRFDFDPTPNDIPSAFLDKESLAQGLGLGNQFDGIPVDDGSVNVLEGLILPETESQEGFEIGLLGTAVLMFGHQVGLPNLFDTDTGRPGIGRWGLMDQGSGNFQGVLPAEPCAWSKVFLGWETAVEIRSGEDLAVAAARAETEEPRIYKIPISRDEYFLLENRQRDVNSDGIAVGRDASGKRVEFKRDQQGERLLAEGVLGVITEVDEYDFGLPGSGLLIWHIDEAVIRERFQANGVNDDPNRRGVDLEEADGAQDIGQVYGFLDPGSGAENGVPEDAFWGSNPINLLVNDTTVVAFTPWSFPDSRSNSGANSHVVITDISEPAGVMTFSVGRENNQPGFPQPTVERLQPQSVTVVDVDGDGLREVFVATTGVLFRPSRTSPGGVGIVGPGKLLGWRADGSRLIANEDPTAILMIARPLEALSTPPVFTDLDGDDILDVVLGSAGRSYSASRLQAFSFKDEDENGRLDPLWAVVNLSPLRATLVLEDGSLVTADEAGEAFRVSAGGDLLWRWPIESAAAVGMARHPNGGVAIAFENGVLTVVSAEGEVVWRRDFGQPFVHGPVVGEFTSAGPAVIVAVAQDGTVLALTLAGDDVAGFPARPESGSSGAPFSAPALADIDRDGFNEIVFASDGQVFALNYNGTLVDGFPTRRPPAFRRRLQAMSAPVIGDVDGDGEADILVGSEAGLLLAVSGGGEVIPGFPFKVGSDPATAAALGDMDADGDIEVAVASNDGILHVYDLPGRATPQAQPWPHYQHDALRTGRAETPQAVSAPETGLLSEGSVYNYPNPTVGNETRIRYRLTAPAEVRVKIYDLAGELVEELTGPGFAQTDNETVWQLDKVQSGVYLARVEAKGESVTDVAVFKIAVVK